MKGLAERARERGHLMVESHRPVLFVRVPLEVALAATAAASVRGRHSGSSLLPGGAGCTALTDNRSHPLQRVSVHEGVRARLTVRPASDNVSYAYPRTYM